MTWTALALPMIRMMKGRWWEAGITVVLLFSVLMGALFFVPAELTPETAEIRPKSPKTTHKRKKSY